MRGSKPAGFSGAGERAARSLAPIGLTRALTADNTWCAARSPPRTSGGAARGSTVPAPRRAAHVQAAIITCSRHTCSRQWPRLALPSSEEASPAPCAGWCCEAAASQHQPAQGAGDASSDDGNARRGHCRLHVCRLHVMMAACTCAARLGAGTVEPRAAPPDVLGGDRAAHQVLSAVSALVRPIGASERAARSPAPLNPAGFEPRIPCVPDSGVVCRVCLSPT